MRFTYRSTRGVERVLPPEIVSHMRHYLISKISFSSALEIGDVHDMLLEYRDPEGRRLLINQLEPIFVYLTRNVHLWPEDNHESD